MNLTLEKIIIDYFKGVKHLELDFQGRSAHISGANGLGKSSILDAYIWATIGTDSHGNSPGSDKFREKPLDENGQIVHNLVTSVLACFRLDGARFDIKRTQEEIWAKKRGSIEATFGGNRSRYYINDLEVKQAEFQERIAAIVNDGMFELVSVLGRFNDLDWRTKRGHLIKLSGSDVDTRLLERDEYRPLADELGARNVSADELMKVLAEQRKSINTTLRMLPVRIDEAKKSLPSFKPNEVQDAEYIIGDSQRSIQVVEQQIIDLKAQGGISNRTQILTLEQELVSLKRRLMDEHAAIKRRLQNEAETASTEYLTASSLLRNKQMEQQSVEKNLKTVQAQRDEMLSEWTTLKKTAIEVSDKCPTCGQVLPQDIVDSTAARLEQEKRDKLNAIQREGKAVREKLDQLLAQSDQVNTEIATLEARLEAAKNAKEATADAVRSFPVEPDFSKEPRIAEIEAEIAGLKAEQATSPSEKIRQLEERKRELQGIIDKNSAIVQRSKIADETKDRISGYERQQAQMGAQLSEVELLIALTEKFVADRCGALEDSINSHFPTVRWKLFDTQINGGITDTCMCMVKCDGVMVPYNCCNTASAINADIQIINVLSDYYGVKVPLFVDNAERVNVLAETNTQTITLSVSTDPELKVTLV